MGAPEDEASGYSERDIKKLNLTLTLAKKQKEAGDSPPLRTLAQGNCCLPSFVGSNLSNLGCFPTTDLLGVAGSCA